MSVRPERALIVGLWTIVGLGLGGGIATLRVLASGEKEIELSTRALRAGDAHGAVEHARRAAGWYAPGAPHVRVAYDRLLALGRAAEGLGDRETALFAFRSARTAVIETRWFLAPHEADRARAEVAIARLSAAAPRAPNMRTEPPAKVEREQLEVLARDEAPRTGWVVALSASAFTWALGAAWIVGRGFGEANRFNWRRALPGMCVTGIGVAAWLLSIWRA